MLCLLSFCFVGHYKISQYLVQWVADHIDAKEIFVKVKQNEQWI